MSPASSTPTGAQELAASIDHALGDPTDDHAPITFSASVDSDERAEFPQSEFDAVVASGLQAAYVPAPFGGALVDTFAPVLGVRAVARRDLTAAVAHGKSFLGAVCSWVAAPELAREVVAPLVLAGESLSWGLTEKGRGSDLVATRTKATSTGGGAWRLEGEKWLINNATRGRAMTVLARTSDDPGPRGLSLLFLDKAETGGEGLSAREKIATHGIRGADISGLGFDGATVPSGRVVGKPGEGLEIVLKSLQVTRTLCTALSLGAADAVLHAVLDIARERQLYGRTLIELPAARDTLADALTDLAIAETVALVGARHLQLLTSEAALVSPLVKYLVPHLIDRMLATLTQFAGARGTLLDGPYAHVQKAVRDNRVVGIFDGNSLVNLHAVVNELPQIGRRVPEPDPLPSGIALSATCAAPLRPEDLRLRTRTGSTLVRQLTELADRASDVLGPRGQDLAAAIARRGDEIAGIARSLRLQRHPEPDRFRLAHEYAVVFAATAVLVHAVENNASGAFWSDPGRLDRALERLAGLLGPVGLGLPAPSFPASLDVATTAEHLVRDARGVPAGVALGIFSGGER